MPTYRSLAPPLSVAFIAGPYAVSVPVFVSGNESSSSRSRTLAMGDERDIHERTDREQVMIDRRRRDTDLPGQPPEAHRTRPVRLDLGDGRCDQCSPKIAMVIRHRPSS